MPSGVPQEVQMNASMIYIPVAGEHSVSVSVYVMTDSDELTETVVQELVDLFQGWDRKDPLNNVLGTVYTTQQIPVTPVDAVDVPPLPDPQPEPETVELVPMSVTGQTEDPAAGSGS